jgi:hypothetical protein
LSCRTWLLVYLGSSYHRKILDVCLYFIHPTFILWLTSSSIPPSLYNINPKYQNMSFMGTTCPSKLTSSSSELSWLNWHLIYSVLVILSLKPFDSKFCLHNSSFWSTLILLSSISTTSSAKSMHQGMFPCMSVQTNIFIIWVVLVELTSHIFGFSHTKSKTFWF